MTKEDWEYYFECRKKHDQPQSFLESVDLDLKAAELRKQGADIKEVVKFLKDNNYALPPRIAYIRKRFDGLKAVQEYNLYEAKKVFPDEF